MFERFTELARLVIFFARDEALNHRHEEIDVEDLLKGIAHVWQELRDLMALPVDLVSNPEPARRMFELTKRNRFSDKQIPFSEESRDVLNRAEEVSRHLESHNITPRHILLGICAVHEGTAAFLEQENVSAADLSFSQEQT